MRTTTGRESHKVPEEKCHKVPQEKKHKVPVEKKRKVSMEKNQHKVPVEKNHGYFGKAVNLSRDDICIFVTINTCSASEKLLPLG